MVAFRSGHHTLICLVLASILLGPVPSLMASEKAKGTLTYKGARKTFTLAIQHAYLVKGPDAFEQGSTLRRIVFSTRDFSAEIKQAEGMEGFDGKLTEGLIVDLVDGPRLNYWMVLNDQLVQYSGTVEPGVLKLTAESDERLAGKIKFDASSAGGPRIDVDFDAPLLKSFSKVR